MKTVGDDMKVLRERARHESSMLRAEIFEPRPSWTEDALCALAAGALMPELFDDCTHWREAATICARCPVRLDCLAAAWREEQGHTWHTRGVRGGLPRAARLKNASQQTAAAYVELERHVLSLPAEVFWTGRAPVAV